MRRSTSRKLGQVVGEAIGAAAERADAAIADRLAEAREGQSDVVRAQLASAAKLRAQADGFLADADAAEAKGKQSKAERLRKVAARPLRQAEEWEAKAAAESDRLRAWAAEQDAVQG